jgi:hypothetical protein
MGCTLLLLLLLLLQLVQAVMCMLHLLWGVSVEHRVSDLVEASACGSHGGVFGVFAELPISSVEATAGGPVVRH